MKSTFPLHKHLSRHLMALALGFSSSLFVGHAEGREVEEVDLKPSQTDVLLNHIIRQQLTRFHFDREQRPLDDRFSEDVFELFLQRVDAQKRLLLQADVDAMAKYRTQIDDDFLRGHFHLPAIAAEVVLKNLEVLEPYCEKLLAGDFDYEKEEVFETDPEKLPYCNTIEELEERWRLHLKYQCLGRYLSSLESEKAKLKSGEKPSVEKLSEEKASVEKLSEEKSSEEKLSDQNSSAESSEDSAVALSEEKDHELRSKAKEKTLKQLKSYFERLRELTHQEHYSRYFNAITTSFDPHTNYMDPATKEDFNIRMSKSLQGIGAVLQEEDDYTKVVRIVPGSASYRQGDLEAGDIILRVAEGDSGEEVDITGMRIREVVSYIRGEKGTVVKLTVKKSDGKIKIIPIERDIVKLEDAVAKSMSLKTSSDRLYGYIYLPDFYRDHQDPSKRNCTEDVRQEIERLKKENIEGLVFDLRGNGGGFLEDARTIAGLFVNSGPVVQVRNSFNKVMVLRDDDRKVTYDGPVVILVDQFSASASEILAAALQDYHRAVIVGSGQTHGKGTVQHLISLDREVPPRWKKGKLGSLKLTIQKFYRINGGSTQMKGVMPDIIIPDDKTYLESGERHLDYALAWDQIPQVKFRTYSEALPLEMLRQKSQSRVEKSEIFQVIEERGARLKERYEDTQVVLSRSAMLDERHKSEEEADHYEEVMEKLKAKLDPEAYQRDQKEKAEREAKEAEDKKKLAEQKKEGSSAEADAVVEAETEKKPKKTPEELKAEETRRWQESVRIDPYVRESMNILDDLIATKVIAKK